MEQYLWVKFPTDGSPVSFTTSDGHKYRIETDPGSHLLLRVGYECGTAEAQFNHPNIIRSVEKTFHYKHYLSGSGNCWTTAEGIEHLLAIPRTAIQIRLSEGYSYPTIRIGGREVRLNTSGGTNGDGWWDWITNDPSTIIGLPMNTLRAVATAAERGTEFEQYETNEERTEKHRRKNEGRWMVVCALGDWHRGVPKGMVGTWAKVNGARGDRGAQERLFLVPKEEYDTRERNLEFVIDPARHQPWIGPPVS